MYIFENSKNAKKLRKALTSHKKFLLIDNSLCPEYVLEEFANDKNQDVQSRAIKRIKDVKLLTKIAHSSNSHSVLMAVLGNPNCPVNIIEYLQNSSDDDISYLAKLQLSLKR